MPRKDLSISATNGAITGEQLLGIDVRERSDGSRSTNIPVEKSQRSALRELNGKKKVWRLRLQPDAFCYVSEKSKRYFAEAVEKAGMDRISTFGGAADNSRPSVFS